VRIGRRQHHPASRARADHREQAALVGKAAPVDLGAGDRPIERREIEHRLGPGQAREVPLERVEHDDRVELATGGGVCRQHVHLVVAALDSRCEDRPALRRVE
jgi:hypothetical protein